MKAEFSIIMPVHNRAHSLERAIGSVLNQTFQDWELLIIDDASTDKSLEIARSYTDPRLRIIALDTNSGAAKARNQGISASKGRFISFLDSDDAYVPDFLAESLQVLSRAAANVGLIWTGVNYVRTLKGNTTVTAMAWKPQRHKSSYLTFLSDLRIGTNSGITIPREVFDKIGLFDERLPAAEDTDLFLRIAREYDYDFTERHLIDIYQNQEDRLSRRFDKIAIAYNLIIPKHQDTIGLNLQLRLKYYYKAMWLNYHLGNKSEARRYFKRLLRDRLFFPKAWMILLLFEVTGRNSGAKLHKSLASLSS